MRSTADMQAAGAESASERRALSADLDPALAASKALAVIVPLAVVAAYAICLAVVPQERWRWFHSEEGPVEIVTALVFLAASLAAMFIAVRIGRADAAAPIYVKAAYLVIAAGSLFMMLEEISWGQHVLGFDSPEVFERLNKQGETNFHNLWGDKPSSTMRKAANIGLPVFGILLPWLVGGRAWGYRRGSWSWYLLPRWELVLWVLLAAAVSPIRKLPWLRGDDSVWRGTLSEFKELLWAATGLIFLLVMIRRLLVIAPRTAPAPDQTAPDGI